MFREVSSMLAKKLNYSVLETAEISKFLNGQIAAKQIRGINPATLQDVEFKVYSQWGEDGIFEYLAQNLPLLETLVEFGSSDYQEANTRFLLQNRNWIGLIMDGNENLINKVKKSSLTWRHDLTAISAFINKDNINELIAKKFRGEIGVLSIDIDGNDYWVLNEINVVNPQVVVAEFNPVWGFENAVTIPYDTSFYRTNAHYSNLYWGCSIKALRTLLAQRGYSYIGSNSAGNNAFFVRNDLAKLLPDTLTNSPKTYVARYRESRDQNGQLNYMSIEKGRELIAEMDLVNLENGQIQKVKSFNWNA